jgi:membrane protein YqaA with SNARE-associated domain
MLKRLYERTIVLAASPRAPFWLAVVAFAESSVFPVPPDPLLLLMGLARPNRVWRFALIATIASVAGGMLGYAIGYALFERLALPVLNFYGYGAKFDAFAQQYQTWGVWVILIKGLTPIPYKLVTIASGALHFDFLTFVLASAATRGARFFLVAALVWRFGDRARDFIERRLMLLTTATAVGVVGGFLALRFL